MRIIFAALAAVSLFVAAPAKAQNIDLGGLLGSILGEVLNQSGAGIRLPQGSIGYGNSDRTQVRNLVLGNDATLSTIQRALQAPGQVVRGQSGNASFAALAGGTGRNAIGQSCTQIQFEIQYLEQTNWGQQRRQQAYNGNVCQDFSGGYQITLN
jgi:hypothetical protein